MNLIDIAIIVIILFSVIAAAYKGFVASVIDIVSFFVSWIFALIFSPVLSRYIAVNHPNVIQTIISFSEGALRIRSIDDRSLPVSVLNSERIASFVEGANFPEPFDRLLLENLENLTLEYATTLGEYFNHSISNVILNILSFIAVYFAVRLFFGVLASVAKGVVGLPVLKQLDWVLGGALGVLRGVLIVNILMLFSSIVLVLVPVELVRSYLDESMLANLFLRVNLFSLFLSARI